MSEEEITSSVFLYVHIQCVSKKTSHSWELKTLGTSYSETTYLLDLKLWQQGVLMSTPCCQISTAYRLVVSGYEVAKVLVSQECRLFFETPCRLLPEIVNPLGGVPWGRVSHMTD